MDEYLTGLRRHLFVVGTTCPRPVLKRRLFVRLTSYDVWRWVWRIDDVGVPIMGTWGTCVDPVMADYERISDRLATSYLRRENDQSCHVASQWAHRRRNLVAFTFKTSQDMKPASKRRERASRPTWTNVWRVSDIRSSSAIIGSTHVVSVHNHANSADSRLATSRRKSAECTTSVSRQVLTMKTTYVSLPLFVSQYMGIWQMFALATVLGCYVVAVYPRKENPNVRNDLHRVLQPRMVRAPEQVVHILWSSTRTDTGKGHWISNHFVPFAVSWLHAACGIYSGWWAQPSPWNAYLVLIAFE